MRLLTVDAAEFTQDLEKIKQILNKYNLNPDSLKSLISGPGINVPVSIFKARGGPLSVLCHYLKDYEKLRFADIAKLINRDQRTVWASYNKLNQKRLDTDEGPRVGIEIFGNRQLSIMEALTFHLIEAHKLRIIEISKLINRSNKTIWCFYDRAKKKNG